MQYELNKNRGIYIGVFEGGDVQIKGNSIPEFGVAKVLDEKEVKLTTHPKTEFF